jgi:O-antigen/teichoic acid export membrane protein
MWKELRKLLRHTAVYGIGSLLTKFVGFLLIPFYTHYLRPSEYGVLELLDLTLSLIALLVNVWVTIPLVRFYYEFPDESEKKKVVSTTLWAVAFIAMCISSLALMFPKNISIWLLKSPDYSYYIKVIAFSFFLNCLNSVAWNYIRAKQRSGLIVSLNLCGMLLMLVLNIFFVGYMKLGVLGVLYGSMIGTGTVTTILIIQTIREVGLRFDLHKLGILAAFGAPLVFTNIGAFVLNFSDRYFLQHFSTVSVVGIYALGYKFGFMLSFLVIQPFSMIWSVRMYEIAEAQNAKQIFSKFSAYFCLVLTTAAIGLSVVIKDVIGFMAAPDFRSAYHIVPLIALAYVFQGMAYYLQTGMLIEKKTIYMGIMGFIGATINITLNFLLIPTFKGMGAAWATALSFLAMAILAYAFSQRTYPIPYRLSKFFLPVILGAAAYLLSTAVKIPSAILAIPIKLLVIPIFWAALYLLGYFDKEEVAKAKSVVGNLIARYRWGAATLPGS